VENPIKGHASFVESIDSMTLLIQQYSIVENIYAKKLKEENSSSRENWARQDTTPLKEAITRLYKSILVYQAHVLRHLAHNKALRILSNTFNPAQWDEQLVTIEKHARGCEDWLAKLGEELLQSMASELGKQSNDLKDFQKSLEASFKRQLDDIKVTHL
jgi:hypothetical protein